MLLTSCLLLAALIPQAVAQNYTQWGLPDGAKARLGKGRLTGNIAHSPDGARLAVASSIGIWLYDAVTHQEVALLTGHMDNVLSVAFSPDGQTLASGSRDGTVRLWEVNTGTHKRTLIRHAEEVISVAFSPDGQTLASGDRLFVQLWDVNTGTEKHAFRAHSYWVSSLAFSPDGQTASGGGDGMVQLWDVLGTRKHAFQAHPSSVSSVAFSPDGQTLASGSRDGTVRLWEVSTGTHTYTLTGHTSAVKSVAFSLDGQTLASGSEDSTVRLWDVNTGTHKHTLTGHTSAVKSVAFSLDEQTLASGSEDGAVQLWDVNTGTHKKTLTRDGDAIETMASSLGGETLASGSRDGTVQLWDVNTGTHKRTLTRHTDAVTSVAFSPDGQTLASSSWDGTVQLWDVSTGTHKGTLTGHTDAVTSIAFSPDGQTLASSSWDGTVRLWKTVTREHRHELTGYLPVFGPDGTTLASAGWDRTIQLWDVSTGTHKRTLTGHTDAVWSLAFSLDGATLASGSEDGTVRLWDINTGAHKRTLTGHIHGVTSMEFSTDGQTLASAGDGTLLLWDLPPSTYTTVSVFPFPVLSPAIGEQFTLSLNISDGKNVAGYQVTIHFDRAALRYVESTNGDYLPEGAFFVAPVVKSNRVTLGATSLTGEGNGDGTLATLTFEVAEVKSSLLILSEVILTNRDGEPLLPRFASGWIKPIAIPSSTIISVIPSPVLSPSIGGQLVFNVDIVGGENVAEHQLTWEFDNTALRHISTSQGDYLAGGIGNGDGRLMTGIFEVLAVKALTVSVSGHLTASNGLRSVPTFESAEVIVPLLGDVNRDGAVNILDLILIGSSFNQQVTEGGNPADVNEDGVVNIVDLVKVASALGNSGAAPSAHPQTLTMLTTTDVKQWLTQTQGLDLTDATLQRGVIFLEQLLAALMPKETTLLPNYPNPFNPETWIPYRLAHNADVTFTIYGTTGAVVRRLDLGHQPAGYYTARTKAAYWDGRNSLGEPVGSGVYFYQLSAGDFSAMRKMVILK